MTEIRIQNLPVMMQVNALLPIIENAKRLDVVLYRNMVTGLVGQKVNDETWNLLSKAYADGSLLGTAIDDTPAGHKYAEEFLGFAETQMFDSDSDILEIGCGTGYLASLMTRMNKKVVCIEPSAQNEKDWSARNLDVRVGFFPEVLEPGERFDVVYSCSVLEHFRDVDTHLKDCLKHLKPKGKLLIAIPDCEKYFSLADPSVILHEHISYFTEQSLNNTLVAAGLEVLEISKSAYGSVLFASAIASKKTKTVRIDQFKLDPESFFLRNVQKKLSDLSKLISLKQDEGIQLGIYCPGRAYNVITDCSGIRFFDDDLNLHGKFYPIWSNPIESFQNLIEEPVDEVWIFSSAFGNIIAERIQKAMPYINVKTLDQILIN